MSGITNSGDKFIPITPKGSAFLLNKSKEAKKSSQEKLEIAEQGIKEVRSGSPRKVSKTISSSSKKEDVLDVKGMIGALDSDITPKKSVQRQNNKSLLVKREIPSFEIVSVTNKLIKALVLTTDFEKKQLKETLAQFDPGEHSFHHGDHIVYVSKPENPDDPLSFGVTNVAQKSFAKGGFGKVYHVDLINSENPLVLKLSRKKLKSKDSQGQLIPLNMDEKKLVAERGSSRGAVAKKDVIREFKMMQYIKNNVSSTVGLGCDAYTSVTYKNQSGLFIKKYDFDGSNFSNYNPSAESRFYAFQQLCFGLFTISELGILHRDIKIENTLFNIVPDDNQFVCDAVISDFGGACFLSDLFAKSDYPSFNSVLGNGTKRNTSFKIACDIDDKLIELRDYDVGTEEYDKITLEIKQLMLLNDVFSIGILLYQLWTDSNPPFRSYNKGGYMKFDSELTREERQEVFDRMELEVYSACQSLPQEQVDNVMKLVMDCLIEGLDIYR